MPRSIPICVGVTVACLLGEGAVGAQDSTASLLTAKSVDDALVIQLLDESAQKTVKTAFQYRTPNESFKPLVSGRVFRASDAVRIEYEAPNPFDIQLSVSESQADDPNAAQLAKFIDKLLTFPTVVGAAQGAQKSDCDALEEVYRRVRLLRTALRVGSTNASQLAQWRKAVDDAPGRAGIVAARAVIAIRIEALKTARAQALDQLKWFEVLVESGKVSASAPAPEPERRGAAFGTEASPFRIVFVAQAGRVPSTPGSGTPAGGAAPNQQPEAAKPGTDPAKDAAAQAAACGSPLELARAFATVIDIGNAREGLKNLDALIDAVTGIAKALEPYASASRWSGTRYLLYVVTPTPDKITTVTVTAAEIKYQFASDGTISQSAGSTSSTKFDFREGGALVPELGAGMIVSRVLTPDYGTTTNDSGALVVAPAVKKSVSYSGALVLNTVCRCGIRSSFLYPMLQFGVSTDGTSPALLFGVGGRFTRPKRLAITGGAILAWIKDLDALHVGSPIKGTADIKADLKFRNEVKPYFGFIYNF